MNKNLTNRRLEILESTVKTLSDIAGKLTKRLIKLEDKLRKKK